MLAETEAETAAETEATATETETAAIFFIQTSELQVRVSEQMKLF